MIELRGVRAGYGGGDVLQGVDLRVARRQHHLHRRARTAPASRRCCGPSAGCCRPRAGRVAARRARRSTALSPGRGHRRRGGPGAPAGRPVRQPDGARQHAGRRLPDPARPGAPAAPALRAGRGLSPDRASGPTTRRRTCRAGSGASSSSLGRWSPSRRSCCSTSRPSAWTRGPARWSSRPRGRSTSWAPPCSWSSRTCASDSSSPTDGVVMERGRVLLAESSAALLRAARHGGDVLRRRARGRSRRPTPPRSPGDRRVPRAARRRRAARSSLGVRGSPDHRRRPHRALHRAPRHPGRPRALDDVARRGRRAVRGALATSG